MHDILVWSDNMYVYPKSMPRALKHESSRNGDVLLTFNVLRIVLRKNGRRFHTNPQLCSNMDMINEIFVRGCTLMKPEITLSHCIFIC